MRAKRILLGAVAAVCVAGWARGQAPGAGGSPPLPASPFPPLQADGLLPAAGAEQPAGPPPAGPPGVVIPPPGQLPAAAPPSATNVLTAPPGQPGAYPPGTVTYPGCGPGGCCGPFGRNGPVGYELYSRTGPSVPIGGGAFEGRLNVGWEVEGGIRTLFFNPPGSAAWVLDLGISYTYNRGNQLNNPLMTFARPATDSTGAITGPDQLAVFGIRGLHRTDLNVAIGRDWFTNGPGFTGGGSKVNWRYGADIGYRYGRAHVDLVPQDNPGNYARRSGITDSILFGGHVDREVNLGGWIFFSGMRIEYVYTWTNVIPPQNGDLVTMNFLMYAGVRY